ncbi:transporter substrate-binding domain-containing protein [Paucibacter sp. R3-3]|uniref:Transporter substrate-binding domain-containing protein n=1 Tax=Roseateles agri TaxID=3098619 RepID=A0ABU5DDQ7_9BURK|nr:transporter substrate-binding domain-containing protein [Paucibacter sp. R3-3]MDY0743868.1 transporter substrate-binding domain-containing protein [Paucibacter sp. R3-3]
MHRALFAFAALSLAAFGAMGAECVKTLRWNDDPPFSMRAADGEVVGIHVEQVREALRRMGCEVRLVEMPWARALTELQAGRLDIVTGAVRTSDREAYAWFAAPGPQSRNVLWIRVDPTKTWRIARLDDLRQNGFRLGAQIGVRYGDDYDDLMRDPEFAATVRHVSTRRNLWLMASAGRIDGLIADEITGRTELEQMGLQDRIRNSGIVITRRSPAGTAFSKKSVDPEFVERFNKVNEAMVKDGSLAAIFQRYGAAP